MTARYRRGWTTLPDKAVEQEHRGLRFRIELEDKGFRLYVDGERRGFFDTLSAAQAHSFWLAERGNPRWAPPASSKTGRRNAPHHRGGARGAS